MYRELDLEPKLRIGVTYNYTPVVVSQDYDVPDDEAEMEIVEYHLIHGDLIDLMYYVDNQSGTFVKHIEELLLIDEL